MKFLHYFFGFVFIILGMNGVAETQSPSAFDFFKPSKHWGMKLSPNGQYVAFVQTESRKVCLDRYGQVEADKSDCKEKNSDRRSQYQVRVFDIKALKSIETVPIPINFYVSWVEFAADDRLLVSMSSRTTLGRGSRYSLGSSRIISVPVQTTKPEHKDPVMLFNDNEGVLDGNRRLSSVSSLLKKDPSHVIMPAYKNGQLDLWKLNVYTGSSALVAEGEEGTFFWYTDKNGEPVLRYDCSFRCRKIRVYAPSTAAPGKWEKIREFKTKPDDKLEDYQFYPVALTDVENQIYVKSLEDNDARHSIKIFDLKTKSYVKTVYEHPKLDVGGVILNHSTGDYMGVWYMDDRLTYDLTDKTAQKHINAINKYFDNEYNVEFVGYDSKGTKAVVYAYGPKSAGAYHIYDFSKASMDMLIETEPDLDRKLSTQARVMKIPMRDGTSITAYHYYPQGQQSGAPLVVMPHGGPHLRDNFDFDYWSQYLVSRGYQVVQMNFRGSSGYGRAFKEAGYGEWGGLMQDDVTDTTKYFHENGLAKAEKTCIVGYSYGGYAALYGGATTPDLYKCIVAGAGPSDLMRMMKDDKGNLNEESYEIMRESVGDPKTEKDKLIARSPVHLAENFKAPVLLIHPERDRRVELSHSKKMMKALKKAGKSVEFLELENEWHSGWDIETEILFIETVEAFLNTHIGDEIQ